MLGEAGSTAIPKNKDIKLARKWGKSSLWPLTKEQATAISGPNNNCKHFWNFCPEVAFERFGLFASDLDKYADEIDLGIAHSHLSKEMATTDDWRWHWANIHSQHYSECSLYSILSIATQEKNFKPAEIVTLKPSIYGISIDIKALWRKVKTWCKVDNG